jgi:hypothetical protein
MLIFFLVRNLRYLIGVHEACAEPAAVLRNRPPRSLEQGATEPPGRPVPKTHCHRCRHAKRRWMEGGSIGLGLCTLPASIDERPVAVFGEWAHDVRIRTWSGVSLFDAKSVDLRVDALFLSYKYSLRMRDCK